MAGFFGFFDYSKPGPGVPKNAPPKKRIVIFFEVLWRKLWNLVHVNLIFSIFNLPALALLFISTQFLIPDVLFGDVEVDFYLRIMISAFFMCLAIPTFGPAQAGLTFVLRNYSREEHAFIWGDFKEHMGKNLKQGLAVCLIDFVVFALLCIALHFYGQMIAEQPWAVILFVIILIAFLLFVMMHFYLYPMMVTFQVTVKQLYKNALIFAVLKFFKNLGFLLIIAAITFAAFIITVLGVLLYFLILPALIGLISNFYSYPTLKKYIIDKLEEQQREAEAAQGGGDGSGAGAGGASDGDADGTVFSDQGPL